MICDLDCDMPLKDNIVPIDISEKTLRKIIYFCTYHVQNKKYEIDPFDTEFTKMDNNELFEIMLAVNYLNIERLLDL